MGLRERLKSARPDLWVFYNRGALGLCLGAAFVGQLVALAVALTNFWRWPQGTVPPVTISDQTSGLLATGTVALAYAALIQAASAERKRIGDLAPHLTIDFVVPSGFEPKNIFLLPNEVKPLAYRVRNMGPGNAMNVRVRTVEWWSPTDKNILDQPKAYGGGPLNPPISTEPSPLSMVSPEVDFSLGANEERHFFGQIFVPPPPNQPTACLEQLVITAFSLDVEGRSSAAVRNGVRLQLVSRRSSPNEIEISSAMWRLFTRQELDSIHWSKRPTIPGIEP